MYLSKEEGANELRDRTMVIVSSRERKHLMTKPEIPMLKYFQVFLHVSKRKGQACHQLRRQRRAAGAIPIDRSELRLQNPPLDRARELHQCMRQINDPIQPGAEQILLTGLLSLPRPHRSPSLVILRARITASDSKESQKQFARKPQRRHPIPAKTITCKGSITHLVQRLGNTSRATFFSEREIACCYFPIG